MQETVLGCCDVVRLYECLAVANQAGVLWPGSHENNFGVG